MTPSEVQKATWTRSQFPHDPVETDDQSQPQTLISFVHRAPETYVLADLMLGTVLLLSGPFLT